MANIWTNVFNFPDDFLLDKKAVKDLSLEQMKKFCRAIEQPHGVVTNGTEPVFVRPGERHRWEQEHPEDNDDKYMTEHERRIKEESSRDPMLDFLSEEEAEQYIKEIKEKKAKYGVEIDEEEYSRKKTFKFYIPWRLNDIPNQYHNKILSGVIPDNYAQEFLSNLPDDVLKKYERYFNKNRIPRELVAYLTDAGTASYKREARKSLAKERDMDDFANDDDEENVDEEEGNEDDDDEIDENEFGEWDRETEFPIGMKELDPERRKMFLNGKIHKSDAVEFVRFLPKSLLKYRDAIREGRIDDEVLMVFMKTDKENFARVKEEYMNQFRVTKDEL